MWGTLEMGEKNGNTLVIGPGPVTLAQGPVFQYTAARGCMYLRRMGFRVIVLEDNPATMMDIGGGEEDLFMEPPVPEVVERIFERIEVGSIWYGLAGERSWRLFMRLAGEGWYERLGMVTPGNEDRALWLCGDRAMLRESLESGGIANPAFHMARNIREGQEAAEKLGFPLVVRPHFSCGGWGAGMAYNLEDFPVLFEESVRDSMTGEVLVEEALDSWRKYIVLALRDGNGRTSIPGIFEQVERLPRHDEDSVLIYPPRSPGKEESYALREMARSVVDALDLLGLVEIKLAADPGWEALYVMDVNPRPWRTMPLLETALGTDLLSAHIDLVLGRSLSREQRELESLRPDGTMLAVPRLRHGRDGDGEGYLALGCMSTGRMICRGRDVNEAAAKALSSLARAGDVVANGEGSLTGKTLMRLGGWGAKDKTGWRAVATIGDGSPQCVSWTLNGEPGGRIIILAGDNEGIGGGYDENVNCYMALRAYRERIGEAALYTTDPGFALLAREEADAVFLGPLEEEAVVQAARVIGSETLLAHYGGIEAMNCAMRLVDRGVNVWGLQALREGAVCSQVLERAGEAGLPVVGFSVSSGQEDGKGILHGENYPLLATVEGTRMGVSERVIYSLEDGVSLTREYADAEILWRPLLEEAQEVQVEAVGVSSGGHMMLLWEQLDATGISSSDGLAVYPPRYLTSEQSQKALELARRAIDLLGWRGNLAMRMLLSNGDIALWSVSPGPSSNASFLHRASSFPLAANGVLALCGIDPGTVWDFKEYSAVRVPIIPYEAIAEDDIMPSPQRRSTGAVMGIAEGPGMALSKALWSLGLRPQPGGRALLSVANREKRRVPLLARELMQAGYLVAATRGTAHALAAAGIKVEEVNKLREGRPNILDLIRNGQVDMVVNIPRGKHPRSDGFYIRAASVRHGIPCITDMEVALALARGMRQAGPPAWEVHALNEYRRPRHEVRGV
jgi:carbamoylphosphate synthase large subunit